MRTIRVTGKGQIRLHPDMTRIVMDLKGRYMDYGEALRRSAEDTDILRGELEGLACMNRTSAEEKIQEMAEQIRNIICRWNSGEPFYTMIHVDGMVVVIDEKGYSVSDPKGKRLTVHRFYGSEFRKDA